jgi:putative acyl-CoA dehydrogenase
MQAALLVRFAPAQISDAFVASRLGPAGGTLTGPGIPFGMLGSGLDLTAVLDRCSTVVAR